MTSILVMSRPSHLVSEVNSCRERERGERETDRQRQTERERERGERRERKGGRERERAEGLKYYVLVHRLEGITAFNARDGIYSDITTLSPQRLDLLDDGSQVKRISCRRSIFPMIVSAAFIL
jgi:hypothetical protein